MLAAFGCDSVASNWAKVGPKLPLACSHCCVAALRTAMRTRVTDASSVAVPAKVYGEPTVAPTAGALTWESGATLPLGGAVVVVVPGMVVVVVVVVVVVLVVVVVGGGGVDPNVRWTRRLTLTAAGPHLPPTSPPNHSPPLPSGMMANTPMGNR